MSSMKWRSASATWGIDLKWPEAWATQACTCQALGLAQVQAVSSGAFFFAPILLSLPAIRLAMFCLCL